MQNEIDLFRSGKIFNYYADKGNACIFHYFSLSVGKIPLRFRKPSYILPRRPDVPPCTGNHAEIYTLNPFFSSSLRNLTHRRFLKRQSILRHDMLSILEYILNG